MTVNVNTELPKGWAVATFEEVLKRMSNGTTEKQAKQQTGIPVTRIETISNGKVDLERLGFIAKPTESLVEQFRLIPGDILFSHINSDSHLGKTALFDLEGYTLLHGMNLLLLRPDKDIVLPKFLDYLCQYYRTRGIFVSIAQHAVNQSSINQTKLKKVTLPLAPFHEQGRIVDKVEELFSFLDAGVESLRKVQAQLKRYRQAVLKYAFEGKLTEQWRKTLKDKIEIDSTYIEKTRLSFGKNKEFLSKDDSINDFELFELPDNWVWTRIGDFSQVMGGKRLPKGQNFSELPTTHPYLRVTDFRKMTVDTKELRYLTPETHDLIKSYTISKEDVYISIAGSIGKVGIVPEILDGANLTENAAKITSIKGIKRKYLCYFLNSPFAEEQSRKFTISTNQPKLALFRIKKIVVPFAPVDEQDRICEEIERHLSIIDGSENMLEPVWLQTEKLRGSILREAFAGKLVTQDPNDEPAEKLLERIKAEKAKTLPKGSTDSNNKTSKIDKQVELSRYVK